jgi:hypothetical protein
MLKFCEIICNNETHKLRSLLCVYFLWLRHRTIIPFESSFLAAVFLQQFLFVSQVRFLVQNIKAVNATPERLDLPATHASDLKNPRTQFVLFFRYLIRCDVLCGHLSVFM